VKRALLYHSFNSDVHIAPNATLHSGLACVHKVHNVDFYQSFKAQKKVFGPALDFGHTSWFT